MFPQVEDESEPDDLDLITNLDAFRNYSGVEEDAKAFEAMESYYEKGFVMIFSTLAEVESHVGCKPTLSKLGCIKKTMHNPTGLQTVWSF